MAVAHDRPLPSSPKKGWVLGILGFILLLAGSIFAVDWMNFFYQNGSLYSALMKPVITLSAMVLVLIAGKNKLEKRDWTLLLLAFGCMLPTDILMSLVVVSPALSVGSSVFMVGGILSILAHIFLILRVGRGFQWLKTFRWQQAWLPVLIYASAAIILVVLWKDITRVGHAAIAPAYTAFFCTTMWFSWETVRRNLYPKPNAWMAGIASTCWFATEITGEVFNLGMGQISDIFFCLVWIFYGTNVVLWALSGYRWIPDKNHNTKSEQRRTRQ